MHLKNLLAAALIVPVAIQITGCASAGANGTASNSGASAASNASLVELQAAQRRVASLEDELAAKEGELAQSKAVAAMPPGAAGDSLFPSNPVPGQCYARVLTPATYNMASERVLVKEASESVEITPAQFETVTERVLVKEASTRIEFVPATYETVSEQVLVRQASTRIEQVPATYRTVTEQVLVTPARTEWKRGPASSFASVLDSRSTDTGEIMCLVEVPAVYETVTRQVVDRAATTREIVVPAEYRTITREVVATPATTREVNVPAEYSTVEVAQEVRPAQERRVAIPAEYSTVTQREKVTDEQLEWRQVVCEVNLTAGNVTALQRALQSKGNYAGPIDGILGPMTLSGANSYARAQGLPVGTNYIANEVVENLGLEF